MHASVNKSILTPVEFLTRSVLVYPGKTAVIHGDKRYSYKEFAERIYRLASALQQKGIGKDDKVAFICPNIPAMLEAHYAVPLIGGVLVSVNIRLSSGEVSYIIDHSDAKLVVADSEFAHLVQPDELPKVKSFVTVCDVNDSISLDGLEYEEFLATGSPEPIEANIDSEDQLLALNYTSGTTGRPKGVMYHHRGAYLNAIGEVLESGLTASSVYLWTLPMFHCNGWCFTWGVTAVGATHVCLRAVVAADIYRLIEKEDVSHLCAAPTILITMKPVPRDGRGIGEIVMRGNNVMTGYYKDPEATEEAFQGGWFHSGDLAVMHPDGYAQIMDRKKDIIISGGENISTVEVESIIYGHPDVQEVAVIPVPDEKWGEVPKAYVVLKAGKTTSAEDIIAYTKEHLARFKAPKYIEFGDLPKTATGKIQKFKLRDKEWEGKKRIG
jgi:acyl-CoA synthetase (AMP-forming)/AMP-acid ligase II